MRSLGKVAAIVLTMTLLTWYWLLGYRTPPAGAEVILPPELEPGQPFTGQLAVNCDWYRYAQQPDVLDCQWQDYSFSFNPKTRIIQRTLLWMQQSRLTIGRLILAWGKPTGFQRRGLLVRVYWPKRYVYVIGQVFRPASRVNLIVWSADEAPQPWRGFTQRQIP